MTAVFRTCSSSTRTARACTGSRTTSTPTCSRPGRPTARRSPLRRTAAPRPTSTPSSSGTCGSPCSISTRVRSSCWDTWIRGRTSTPPGRPTKPAAEAAAPAPAEEQPGGASVYRSPTGFRASGTVPQGSDSGAGPAPVSVKALLDSSPALPDTSEFTFKVYHTRYTPDYVARPTVGYERDNFGRGFFGGTAISLSDILGNHTMVFSGAVNGRLSEAQVLAVYINQAHRLNWAFGGSQQPLYFYLPTLTDSTRTYVRQQIERFVIRDIFAQGFYPFNRFTRLELGAHLSNISQDILQQDFQWAPQYGAYVPSSDPVTVPGPSISYYGPQVALVHD